jgi:hypothetical protein
MFKSSEQHKVESSSTLPAACDHRRGFPRDGGLVLRVFLGTATGVRFVAATLISAALNLAGRLNSRCSFAASALLAGLRTPAILGSAVAASWMRDRPQRTTAPPF